MDYNLYTVLTIVTVIYGLVEETNGLYSAAKLRLKTRRDLHNSNCGPCNIHNCATVLPETCSGRMVKDHCNCCPFCNTTEVAVFPRKSETEQIEYEVGDEDPEACKQIECPRQQICLLNIQGIPVCRCPSSMYCKDRPRKELCSEEDKTYRSLCYLKMEACVSDKKIAVKHKGPCEGDVIDREQRKQLKEERQEQRLERQRLKMEKKGKHNGKKGHRWNPAPGKRKRKNDGEKANSKNAPRKKVTKKELKEELKREKRRHRRRLRKIKKNNAFKFL